MKKVIILTILLCAAVSHAGVSIGGGGGTTGDATTIHGLAVENPEAADDGKYFQYEHTGTLWQLATPPGGGDMLEAVFDGDADGFIDADQGGTDIDTSAETGVPSISAGTWSVGATLVHELGGLEADISGYSGLLGVTGGATAVIDDAAKLETYAGLGAFANEYLDDANAAAVLVTLGLSATAAEINTPLDGATVTLTEFEELATVGETTVSANQWAAVGSMPETVTGTELGYVDGVTSSIQTQIGTKQATLTNEAGLYSALSDVADFFQPGDPVLTSGTDDSTAGLASVYGSGTGDPGQLRLYNEGDNDTFEYWQFTPEGSQLEISTPTGTVTWTFHEDGILNPSNTPGFKLYDEGTTSNALVVSGNVDGNNDATIDFDVLINDVEVEMMSLDGAANSGAGAVILSHAVSAPSIDAGMLFVSASVDTDLQTLYSGTRRMMFNSGAAAGDTTWTLADEGLTGTASMREWIFVNNDTDSDLIVAVGEAGDEIKVKGSQAEDCDANISLYIDPNGMVIFYGRTDDVWYAVPMGGTDVDCGVSP